MGMQVEEAGGPAGGGMMETEGPDEDGWQTVPARRRSGRRAAGQRQVYNASGM